MDERLRKDVGEAIRRVRELTRLAQKIYYKLG
jgi:hypothetical protein